MASQRTADRLYDEGRRFHDAGKLSSAERAYKKALRIDPDLVEAHNNLGTVYLDGGRLREASHAFRKALKLLPGHPLLLNNLGNVLQLQGDSDKAIDYFRQAIEADPENFEAQANLGNAYRALQQSDKAIAAYRRALEINPQHADAHYNLGITLLELEELDGAIDRFDRCIEIKPDDVNAWLGIARARSTQGDLDAAVSAFRRAIEIDPGNALAHKDLGSTLSDHGEIEAAVEALRRALELDPTCAGAYRLLSMIRRFTSHDEDIKAMESLFARKGVTDADRVQLGFGLAKAFEDLGEYDRAMHYLQQATRLKRKGYHYSTAESRAQFAEIEATFSREFFDRHRDCGDTDPTPIFILGMPRSGTSLVEQILASHPDVHGAGELRELGKVLESIRADNETDGGIIPPQLVQLDDAAFAELGRQYVQRIRRHAPEARFITDKMPHNFARIGFIRLILPKARIIHCRREPMDNCLSIFKTHLQDGHGFADDLAELGEYYRLYHHLMEHWRQVLPGFVHDLHYEALVTSAREQIEQLLQYCGLPWDDACLAFHRTRRKVETASNAQVRRPIYRDSVARWRRYEAHLEPLKTALGDLVDD